MMTSRVPRLVGCKVASWAESVIILLLRAWLLSFCGHACALRWAVGAWARLGAWAPSLVCGGFARRHFFSYPFTLAGACMYVPLAPAAGRKEGTRINTDSRAPPAPQDDRTQHIPSPSTRRPACVVHQLRHSSDDVRCAALVHEMGKRGGGGGGAPGDKSCTRTCTCCPCTCTCCTHQGAAPANVSAIQKQARGLHPTESPRITCPCVDTASS